jgi:hypothetical protein
LRRPARGAARPTYSAPRKARNVGRPAATLAILTNPLPFRAKHHGETDQERRAASADGGARRGFAVSTTTSTYLSISKNLARYQQMVADQPTVKTASDYYAANIGKVTSISDFVGNYRLLSYALKAYGLGEYVNDTGLVTKVLEGGVTNSNSLANTLSNSNWKTFATAFDFVGSGASSISTSSAVQTTESDYVEEQLETQEGEQDPGVQLALYFQRVAPTVSTGLQIMGDKNLLDVVQTIFGLPAESSSTDVNTEAKEIERLMPLSELKDSKELTQLTERFTASYEKDYGTGGTDASTPLSVVSDGDSTISDTAAASSILDSVIGSDSTASYFESALLSEATSSYTV